MDESDGRYLAARMVLNLRQGGVADKRVLEAMERTPREPFVPLSLAESAWDDIELPIDCGQNLTRPVTVGRVVEALDLNRTHSVLEIGCGTGYQAAVLTRLARRVYTIDRWRTLIDQAESAFDRLGVERVATRVGDGLLGWPDAAPFDRIVLTGSVVAAPQDLAKQLAPEGLLIAPIDAGGGQSLIVYKKGPAGRLVGKELMKSRFTPLQPGVARQL